MEISGEMQNNKLKIIVTFDEPEQVAVFHEFFEKMLKEFSDHMNATMVDATPDGPMTKKDIAEKLNDLYNKFGNL
jgi:hypothetical protein